jgi:hypothetical protein
MSSITQSDAALLQAVHDAYSVKAKLGADDSCTDSSLLAVAGCLLKTPIDSKNVAQAFGYTPEQLQAIPAESNMGLSCGNPVAAASIKKVPQSQSKI